VACRRGVERRDSADASEQVVFAGPIPVTMVGAFGDAESLLDLRHCCFHCAAAFVSLVIKEVRKCEFLPLDCSTHPSLLHS